MKETMSRFQIYLTDGQARRLSELSTTLHRKKAELVREAVDLWIGRHDTGREDPLLSLIGQAGDVGRSDVSEHHDGYLTSEAR